MTSSGYALAPSFYKNIHYKPENGLLYSLPQSNPSHKVSENILQTISSAIQSSLLVKERQGCAFTKEN
jgi:hypothetical protein